MSDGPPDGHRRIKRGMRILENDLHLPSQGPEASASNLGDVLTGKEDSARGWVEQSDARFTHCGLATSAFANEAQYFPRVNAKRHAVDGVDHSLLSLQKALDERHLHWKMDVQIVKSENFIAQLRLSQSVRTDHRNLSPKWQAAKWPGSNSTRGGSLSTQIDWA